MRQARIKKLKLPREIAAQNPDASHGELAKLVNETLHSSSGEGASPRAIEEIIRLFPPRSASSVSDKQAFYILMPNGDLIGGENEEYGHFNHFNHSAIMGLVNYMNKDEFYRKHGALRVDINQYLYVDLMFAPSKAQRLAIGQMYRTIGYHEMTWQIAWLPDRTKRTEGTLPQFFKALDEAISHLET